MTAHRVRGRPVGDVGQALMSAASHGGPATVRVLAERACVGYAAARYTASRLVSRGALVPVSPARPATLAPAAPRSARSAPAAVDAATARPWAELETALRSFWEDQDA